MTGGHVETSSDLLRRQLHELGIRPGGPLMVHASLRAVGPVEGRGEGLVRCLLDALGEDGTLVAYLDFEPTESIPHFDPAQSPAARDHGVLAEILRTWPGAVRSLNPGASIVAIGAQAEWICRDHPLNYGYGEGSPFARLVDLEGSILLLGSDFDHVTLLHHAEHLADLPGKRVVRPTYLILYGDAVTTIEIEEFETARPVVAGMPMDYFAQLIQRFVETGAAHMGTVGRAASVFLSARRLVEFAVEEMEREYG